MNEEGIKLPTTAEENSEELIAKHEARIEQLRKEIECIEREKRQIMGSVWGDENRYEK